MTVAIAVIMALAGIIALVGEIGDSHHEQSGISILHFLVVPTSVLIWSYIGYRIRNYYEKLSHVILFGVLSPFIGAVVAGLPIYFIGGIFGFLLAMTYYYVTIPIGIITGIGVWAINKNPDVT